MVVVVYAFLVLVLALLNSFGDGVGVGVGPRKTTRRYRSDYELWLSKDLGTAVASKEHQQQPTPPAHQHNKYNTTSTQPPYTTKYLEKKKDAQKQNDLQEIASTFAPLTKMLPRHAAGFCSAIFNAGAALSGR